VNGWQGIILALTAVSLVMGCAANPYLSTGAAVGGGLGALTGAAINHRNPWQGAAIGGLVGGALGAVGGEVVRPRQPGPPPPQGYYQPDYGPQYGRPGYRPPPPNPNYSSRPPVTAPNYGNSAPPGAGDYYSQTPPPQPDGCRAPMTYVPYYY
jgi:hypothetical protein